MRDANGRESAAAAVLMALVSSPRQRYPTRPLGLIVASAPGGGNAITARVAAGVRGVQPVGTRGVGESGQGVGRACQLFIKFSAI